MKAESSLSRRLLLAASLLTLTVAAVLRLARLPELPLGLHYDEAANGILASEIARGGEWPAFIPSYTGKEVLFFYWAAAWMRLLGEGVLALRLTSAVAGLCTLGAAAWSAYELFRDRRGAAWIGVLTAAFVATSFWHLVLSRYGFRAVTQPLLQALTVAALWRGLRLRSRGWLVLAGLFCGATAYTYLAARAFPLALGIALVALLVADADDRPLRFRQMLLFVATAALALVPLALYFLRNPTAFTTRIGQVAAASAGDALEGFVACLRMLFLRGDPYVRFNIPYLPLLDLGTAFLFLLGLLMNLGLGTRRNGSPVNRSPLSGASRALLLAVLVVMLLPSALATGEITPSNLRVVGLLPFIYILPALPLVWVGERMGQRAVGRVCIRAEFWHMGALVLVLVILTPLTAARYFGGWAGTAHLYQEADGDMVDVAAYLNQLDLVGTVPYVASRHYRHPTLAFLAADYASVRWLAGGESLVVPADREGLVVLPRSADRVLDWTEGRLEGWELVTVPLGPDGQPAFHAYRIPPDSTFELPSVLEERLQTISLTGYEVLGVSRSGESVEALLAWRVTAQPELGDYIPLLRLVDQWDNVWGQVRPFHYPSEQWTLGEQWLDHVAVPVEPGTPPGEYRLQVGFYSESGGTSLPVLDAAGAYAGSAVEIPASLERASVSPAVDELGVRERIDLSGDGLVFVGFNLDTLAARSGEPLYLTAFWQAERASLRDLQVRLTLGDSELYAGPPVHGTYPTSLWAAGEVVVDRYAVRIDRDMPSAVYPLRLELLDATGVALGPVDLGQVDVEAVTRSFDVPEMAYPVDASLGQRVELLGYDLDGGAGGGELVVTLYWRAVTEMEVSYTVFNHLLDADRFQVAGHDGVPAAGSYPPTLWVAGEVVVDPHVLELPADLEPGEYELEVGMYILETGQRLDVLGSSDGAVHLRLTLPLE